MGATAADIPSRFDVLINGEGYVFDDAIDPTSLYSSRQRAQFGFTPLFVTRQNVQGDYGDNQQDFWLTATQRDWSLGEQQRYFRQGDEDAKRRYWHGTSVDRSKFGQVAMADAVKAITFPAAVRAVANYGSPSSGGAVAGSLLAAGTTNLYQLDYDGTITDLGAHGVTATPASYGIATDGIYLYLTSTGGVVRKRNLSAGTWSTFSATGATALAFLNNTLYGYRFSGGLGDLIRYDSAGAVTSIFTWKTADGVANPFHTHLRAFGGKLLILRSDFAPSGSELWIYDGIAPAMVAEFPPDFFAYQLEIFGGAAYIGGSRQHGGSTGGTSRPTIWYYANGSLGKLWEADKDLGTGGGTANITNQVAMTPFGGGLVFNDDTRGVLCFYDPSTGGISTLASYTVAGDTPRLASSVNLLVHTRNQTTGYLFPDTVRATSATVISSLFDFDSSLDKRFHAIRVDFDSATDGNGGTVDIAYRLNDVDGSYTSLATGVTSGVEIPLTNISGRAISVKVTLNKGTSTDGPVLKRIAVRASPVQPQFVIASYILNCSGTAREPETLITLRDDSRHGKTGLEMVADLKAAVASSNPISITDPINGTFTGIIDADNFQIQAVSHMDEFRVTLTIREV